MIYQSKSEKFVDGVDWTCDDPCVWIVYPPGSAGDLVASIINFHYARTGSFYFGLAPNGQVIFRPSDGKIINQKYHRQMDPTQLVYDVNFEIGSKNLNYSLLSQIIFSNHLYQEFQITRILECFKQAKIIRILPATGFEKDIIRWLAAYKNDNVVVKEFKEVTTDIYRDALSDNRLLDVQFGRLFNEETFDQIYDQIVDHLDLPYKLIRFDMVEFWLNHQHEIIRPMLNKINERKK